MENSNRVQIYDPDLRIWHAACLYLRGNNLGLRAGSQAATKENHSCHSRKGLCAQDPHVPWQRPEKGSNMKEVSQPLLWQQVKTGAKTRTDTPVAKTGSPVLLACASWMCDYVSLASVYLSLAFQLPGVPEGHLTDEL